MQIDRDFLNGLYRYAFTLCADPDLAADLTQDTLEVLLKKKRQLQQHDNIAAYARRVLRNRFYDQYRHQTVEQRHQAEEMALNTISTEGFQQLDNMIMNRNLLEKSWQALSAEERELMYFWAVHEMTTDQVASVMDMPRGTLLSKIHRLRLRLKSLFTENGGRHENL